MESLQAYRLQNHSRDHEGWCADRRIRGFRHRLCHQRQCGVGPASRGDRRQGWRLAHFRGRQRHDLACLLCRPAGADPVTIPSSRREKYATGTADPAGALPSMRSPPGDWGCISIMTPPPSHSSPNLSPRRAAGIDRSPAGEQDPPPSMAAGPADSWSEAVIETDIPMRLDALPFGRFHVLVIIALGITWILDGLEVTLAGALSAELMRPSALGLSNTQIGLAGSSYLAGAVL